MFLQHLESEDKFGRRLVWKEAAKEAEDLNESGKVNKHDVKVESVKSVDAANDVLDDEAGKVLDNIQALKDSSCGRMRNTWEWATKSNKALTETVHLFHEGKAIDALDYQYGLSQRKLKKMRKGRVEKWGKDEVAISTAKHKELNETRKTLEASISAHQAQAAQYKKLVEQLRASDISTSFWQWQKTRISKGEYKDLMSREPHRIDEIKEVKEVVTTVERETDKNLRAYDRRFTEENKEYTTLENNFKNYLFSFPVFGNDPELQADFEKYMEADQLGTPETKDQEGVLFEKMQNAVVDKKITNEQFDALCDLRSALIKPKDADRRELIKARNIETEVPNVDPDLLKRLPKGQTLSVSYDMVSQMNINTKRETKSGKKTPVTQDMVISATSGDVIEFTVKPHDIKNAPNIVRKESKWTEQIKDSSGRLTNTKTHEARTTEYQPKSQQITINLSTGELTSVIEATDLGKDNKGRIVKFTDTSSFKFEKEKYSGSINSISGKVKQKDLIS